MSFDDHNKLPLPFLHSPKLKIQFITSLWFVTVMVMIINICCVGESTRFKHGSNTEHIDGISCFIIRLSIPHYKVTVDQQYPLHFSKQLLSPVKSTPQLLPSDQWSRSRQRQFLSGISYNYNQYNIIMLVPLKHHSVMAKLTKFIDLGVIGDMWMWHLSLSLSLCAKTKNGVKSLMLSRVWYNMLWQLLIAPQSHHNLSVWLKKGTSS